MDDAQPTVIVLGDNELARGVARLVEFLGRPVIALHADALEALAGRPPLAGDAVVVCDHDAPYADAVLRVALPSPASFVGMVASRRRAPAVMRQLLDGGMSEEVVARLHAPCGLDIGSRGPAEIALSVVAEIVAVSRGRDSAGMQSSVADARASDGVAPPHC